MRKILIACGVIGGAWVYAHADNASTVNARPDTIPDVQVRVGNIYQQSADISVYNTSGKRLQSVFLHCTFRDANGQRIDSVPVLVADLAINDTAKERPTTAKHATIASVECLTEHAF